VKYSQFEWLVLAVGSVAVIGTVLVGMASAAPPSWEEIVGQLLIIPVLFAALHWGRNGGFFAAVAALVAYVIVRVPTALQSGVSSDLVYLIVVRGVVYAFIGVVGGEIAGRIKYFFASLEGTSSVDPETRVFNETMVRQIVCTELGKARRYGAHFSIVVFEVAPRLLEELRPVKRRSILRHVANYMRNDVRLVDDLGRIDDGRFVLILPHTPREGATVAADRVRSGVRDMLGAKDESVSAQVLCSEGDEATLEAFIDSLKKPDEGDPDAAVACA
jgi:GGDEF domain-containing protein